MFTALVTIFLASFALGLWQVAPQEVKDERDTKGASVSGLYDVASDTYIGDTQVVFTNGIIYNGGFTNHRFNGYGVCRGEGTTEAGEVYSWRYEGTFANGRLEGEGSYSDHLGIYVGGFSGSLPSGQGVYTSHSGWRYEGEFQAGSMTGRGTVFLADGSASSGLFEDGLQVSVD